MKKKNGRRSKQARGNDTISIFRYYYNLNHFKSAIPSCREIYLKIVKNHINCMRKTRILGSQKRARPASAKKMDQNASRERFLKGIRTPEIFLKN